MFELKLSFNGNKSLRVFCILATKLNRMGVIYGYISLTDKSVDPSIPETMRKANSFWNPDGDRLWISDSAAIGSLIMFNTPEAIFEKQPVQFGNDRYVLVASARIDNRDDLCRIFEIPLSARDIYPDSYYIRLAYEKWGEDCPDHLIGDWSFVVYDKTTRRLFIARDHHGITAMYYYHGSDFFVFSSSLKGILCLPQVPKKVNEYKIAQILVNWNEGGPPTCYQDIYRLPPAHTLTVQDRKVKTNQYWYLEHTPEIRLKNDDAYVEMFRELYTEAVRCRLRSYRPVGATLSGGLDSGSVVILAAQELAKQGKRLPAFTAVPMYDVPWPKNRIGDEGPLALALAQKLGNVDVTLCKAEDIDPIEGVKKMFTVHDQLGFSVSNAYWIIDILQKNKYLEIGTLLTGQCGNGTVSWKAKEKEKIYNLKLWRKYFIQLYRLKSGKIFDDVSLNPDFLKRINFNKRLMEAKSKPKFYPSLNDDISRIVKLSTAFDIAGFLWFESGQSFKIEVRDPTMDYKLTNALFKLPLDSIYNKNRQLFRKSFNNYFPSNLYQGVGKGIQAIDILIRFQKTFDLENINEITNNYFKISEIQINNLHARKKINSLLNIYSFKIFTDTIKN